MIFHFKQISENELIRSVSLNTELSQTIVVILV